MKIALLILRNAYADRIDGLDALVREWSDHPELRARLDDHGRQTREEMDEIASAIRILAATSPGTSPWPTENMEEEPPLLFPDALPSKKADAPG